MMTRYRSANGTEIRKGVEFFRYLCYEYIDAAKNQIKAIDIEIYCRIKHNLIFHT